MEIIKEVKVGKLTIAAYVQDDSSDMWVEPSEINNAPIKVASVDDQWGTEEYDDSIIDIILESKNYICKLIYTEHSQYKITDVNGVNDVLGKNIEAIVYGTKNLDGFVDSYDDAYNYVSKYAKDVVDYYYLKLYRICIAICADAYIVNGVFPNKEDINIDKLEIKETFQEVSSAWVVSTYVDSESCVEDLLADLKEDFKDDDVKFEDLTDTIKSVVEEVKIRCS